MTDIRQVDSNLTAAKTLDTTGSEVVSGTRTVREFAVAADANRHERRRMIRAAVASAPVLLTFTAGKSLAAGDSVVDSGAESPAALQAPDDEQNLKAGEEEEEGGGALTPAEKLETFGLQRSEGSEGNTGDPYRDLDSVHDNN